MSLLDGNDGDGVKAREVLDFCLSNESPDLKGKVYEIIGRSGLDPSDPMFLVLALTGQMRVFLEAAPQELNLLLEKWKNQSASSLLEITEAIAKLKQAQQEQAEAIRENMEAVSLGYVTEIKKAGMATTSAIADANSETLERVGQTKQQSEQLLEKLTALKVNLDADEQQSLKSKRAFVEWLGKITGELNEIRQKLDSSHSAIERLQLKTFWLKWAEWLSPLLALIIVGGAGLLAGGWLTYQKYNTDVDKLGRNIISWNLDRYLKCSDDQNPKCTFWIVPPDSPKREGVE
jgi:hypothetical protein